MPKASYTAHASVHTYESGPDGLLKPEVLLHWFQEIAQEHASILGFGYDFVISRGLAWVEVHLDATILRFPHWKEKVKLLTTTNQETPLLARRNLEIQDEQGNVLILASCLWALIDIRRKRPVPLNKYITSFPNTICKKLVSPVSTNTSGIIPSIREWTAERRDTDFNHHINNAAYLVWALESLPSSWQENHVLTGIHLHFKKETHAGDHMKSLFFNHDNFTVHHLLCEDEIRAEVILNWDSTAIK